MRTDVPDLQEIADRIVARASGGEQIEAVVGRGGDTSIRVYEGEVEHFVSAQSQGIGIRVIHEGRTGTAYAGSLDESVIADVLAQARDNARYGTVDPYAGLAEPDGVAPVPQVLWNDELAAWPTDAKVEMAKELEKRALAADPRVRTEEANYEDDWSESAFATTTGIRVSGRGNSCYVSVATLADDGDATQTGFGFSVGDSPRDLDLGKAAHQAAERATRLLGATKPSSRRTTIVLDPYVTAQFIGILSSAFSGENVAKGRSIFADRIGEVVATPQLTILDDPTNALAYTATDIDGEGLAARRNVLIDRGELKMHVHSSYSARRMNTHSTGNATRGGFASSPGVGCLAMQVTPGSHTQAELIAGIDEGVLIQDVSGLHSGVNPVSGDFSTGAAGMLIAGGALAGPVREFTIASTLQRMLLDIVAIGNDVDWLPMRAAGLTLVIGDVTLSGT